MMDDVHDAGGRPASMWTDVDGPVHYVDHGGPDGAPQVLLVHGLGGSLLNWMALAPLLTPQYRVVALDLAGFGHTRGWSRSTSVRANQRLLNHFIERVTGAPVILVGNSMGGLISILQTDAHPDTVAALALVDPALSPNPLRHRPDPRVLGTFAALAVPAAGRAMLARRRNNSTARESAEDLLRLCCVDPSRIPRDVREEHVALAEKRREYPDTDDEMIVAARSLLWVLTERRRYSAMQRGIRVPVLLLHGDKDRLVPIEAAEDAASANPSWRFEVAENVGHVPQLEVPDWTASRIIDWLRDHPDAAAAASNAQSPWERSA